MEHGFHGCSNGCSRKRRAFRMTSIEDNEGFTQALVSRLRHSVFQKTGKPLSCLGVAPQAGSRVLYNQQHELSTAVSCSSAAPKGISKDAARRADGLLINDMLPVNQSLSGGPVRSSGELLRDFFTAACLRECGTGPSSHIAKEAFESAGASEWNQNAAKVPLPMT